jgi:hypothetical protein
MKIEEFYDAEIHGRYPGLFPGGDYIGTINPGKAWTQLWYRRGIFWFQRTFKTQDVSHYEDIIYRVVVPKLWLPDPIPGVTFVFGSNLKGAHGRGAALTAKNCYGAETGVGRGQTQYTYALPTKHTPNKSMELHEIAEEVETFLHYARENQHAIFLVTALGCGLAYYENTDIAPMFRHAPSNCILPKVWTPYLPELFASPRIWHKRDGVTPIPDREGWSLSGHIFDTQVLFLGD